MWFGLVWLLTKNVSIRAQCNTREEDFNSPNGEPYFITEEVVPNELLITMFRYLHLLRKEFWYIATDNITVTKAGDPSCVFVGNGVKLEEVESLDQEWKIPLLTNVQIVGDKIFIPGERNTFATITQFESLIKILNLKSTVKLDKDPRLVVEISKKMLSNFDVQVMNSCHMTNLALNIRHKMQTMLITIDDTWRQFLSIMRFFGQEKSIQTLGQCCRDKNLSLQSILYLPDAIFKVCSQ